MGRLFVTGDTHGGLDMSKLSTRKFNCAGLTKDDILVIMGDVGLVWADSATERFWQKWLNDKPWTTFCVLGNHENYDRIEELPTAVFGGQECWKVNDSVYYAKTGLIYELCGKKCLVVNGADSTDVFINGKRQRSPHISWWEQERITPEQAQFAIDNVKEAGGTVDFVFSHTGGIEVCNFLGYKPWPSDIELQKVLDSTIYQAHYCGHYHTDKITPTCRILYQDIKLIAIDKGEE
jgi:hypothetical protein